MTNVIIIDYGMGNIKSIQRGLEKVGAKVMLTSNPKDILAADNLILPGVGGFKEGMNGLKQLGIIPTINEFVKTGKPLLGICLGMQMLFDFSEEFGIHEGLGFIPGIVKEIPQNKNNLRVRKIPHIGWSALNSSNKQYQWHDSILSYTKIGEYFYFLHSFMAIPSDSKHLLAYCNYKGVKITSAVQKRNIIGLQFHPEKSGESGLKILKSFVCK